MGSCEAAATDVDAFVAGNGEGRLHPARDVTIKEKATIRNAFKAASSMAIRSILNSEIILVGYLLATSTLAKHPCEAHPKGAKRSECARRDRAGSPKTQCWPAADLKSYSS